MAVTETNRRRYRAKLISREVKYLFGGVPERLKALLPRRWLWRWLFLGPEDKPHRSGEILLADLRDFAGIPHSPFHPDPIIMARRVGRQEVVQRIFNYLNLDEEAVQQLMELDDGLE